MSAEIIHGDCLDVMGTLASASVDCIVTDPPYLRVGSASASEVSRAKGAPVAAERQFFDAWMREVWAEFARVLRPTGALWLSIDWRGAVSCEQAATRSPLRFRDVGVWDKDIIGMGHVLRHQTEHFVVASMPEWTRRTASEPDLWRIRWRSQGEHAAEKPVELMCRAINLVAGPGALVLDPFSGIGSTAVAAIETGRRFIGIEREAAYVEIARKRIADAQAQLGLGVA